VSDARAVLYHNLWVLLESGVPIGKALSTASSSMAWVRRHTVKGVARAVASGERLADAMAARGGAFARFDVAMVRAGETSGHLDESFKMLAEWYEFRQRQRRTVAGGLVLPFCVLHFAAFVAPLPAFLLGKVSTEGFLIDVARTLGLFYVPALIIAAIACLTPAAGIIRRLIDELLLCVPLLGGGLRHLALSRYCRVFGFAYGAGVPLAMSAKMAADTCGNAAIRARMQGAVRSAQAGNGMSEGMAGRVPREFAAAWAAGEQAGSLDRVVDRLAAAAADDSQRALTAFATWLPRLIYFLVCMQIIRLILAALPQIMNIPVPH
jgi:type II secretory pathway component PulF